MRPRLAALILLCIACFAARAHADTVDFVVSGGGNTVDFSLPAASTFSDDNQFGATTTGTFNGTPTSISLDLIFPGPCSVCDSIILGSNVKELYLGLPSFYSLSSPTMSTETITFLQGSYNTISIPPNRPYDVPYTITITPEAAAVTPEPPTLLLLTTAVLIAFAFTRQGNTRAERPQEL